MKTKPILIILAGITLLVCIFFFVKAKYFNKPVQNSEAIQFLSDFTYQLKGKNIDSALQYFQIKNNEKEIVLLIKVLSGKTGLNGLSEPEFMLTPNNTEIKVISNNSDITTLQLPVTLTGKAWEKIDPKVSLLIFTIRKISDHQYKITNVKTDIFLKDYLEYAKLIRVINPPQEITFNAITIAAFKNAALLKARYDSVLWFQHINDKTYFYVIKGTLNQKFYLDEKDGNYSPTYAMGLVNPQLKEIIPPLYNLVHNIGGTIDGLIEVEKNGKRGFYNLNGQLKVPVNYDHIYPLKEGDNLALLQSGDDYFYLKNDTTITDKIIDLNIADVLPQIKIYGNSFTLTPSSYENIMEYNNRDELNSVVVSPSYLVDLEIMPEFLMMPDPLRKSNYNNDDEGSNSLEIKFDDADNKQSGNWFESIFYSLYNDYIGAREGLYEGKTVVIADKKRNKLMGYSVPVDLDSEVGGGTLNYTLCRVSAVHAVNDSVYEFTTTSRLDQMMLKDTLDAGPYYHYMCVKDGKLVGLPCQRIFSCTKYVKLDDSYLSGCFIVNGEKVDHATNEILQYMENEIYASYGYQFKTKAWNDIFTDRFYQEYGGHKNANVDDSLTTIDRYNINWIKQKLKAPEKESLAAN